MLALFLAEGRELLNRVDAELLVLERAPDARDAIDKVFRALHSLKGMSATVGYIHDKTAGYTSDQSHQHGRDDGIVPFSRPLPKRSGIINPKLFDQFGFNLLELFSAALLLLTLLTQYPIWVQKVFEIRTGEGT